MLLMLQANFADNYVSLSSSDVYKIDGVDMFVIVKKSDSDSLSGNCACAPVRFTHLPAIFQSVIEEYAISINVQ